MPATGGAVLAANHLSAIDHPLLGLHSRRSIFFLSKQELLEKPVVGEVLSWAGVFPVRRGAADREALRRACALVREGHVVGIHPEGTRQRTGHPGEMRVRRRRDRADRRSPGRSVRPCDVRVVGSQPAAVRGRLR